AFQAIKRHDFFVKTIPGEDEPDEYLATIDNLFHGLSITTESNVRRLVEFNSGDCIYSIYNELVILSSSKTEPSIYENFKNDIDSSANITVFDLAGSIKTLGVSEIIKVILDSFKIIISGVAIWKVGTKLIVFSNQATEQLIFKKLTNFGLTKSFSRKISPTLTVFAKKPGAKATGVSL